VKFDNPDPPINPSNPLFPTIQKGLVFCFGEPENSRKNGRGVEFETVISSLNKLT
jgi:hypothetical protein